LNLQVRFPAEIQRQTHGVGFPLEFEKILLIECREGSELCVLGIDEYSWLIAKPILLKIYF